MRGRRSVTLGVGLGLFVAACGGGGEPDTADGRASEAEHPEPAAAMAFPDPEWDELAAADAQLDPEGLKALVAEAEATGSGCLAVTRHGRLVGEWYFEDWDEETTTHWFSATKSLAGTLIGIAQGDGFLDIDDPVSEYIPEWVGTESEAVTIRNLLADDSGREWSIATDYQELPFAESTTDYAVGLGQQHRPDEHWEYNNAAIQVLEGVLEAAVGEDSTTWARQQLLDPLGLEGTWHTDARGNIQMFTGYDGSCRDGLRFGNLFLARGDWAGEQIVSEAWVDEATTMPSQDLNAAYGLLWWRNDDEGWLTVGEGGHRVPAENERYWPGVPLDAFAALGNGGQAVAVHPSTGLVMVRLEPVSELRPSTVPADLQRLLAAADLAP